jgi:hypothetical protein
MLDLIPVFTAFLILGMIWLRTRIQYARRGSTLQLQRVGWIYFGGALGLMGLGWLVAPALGAEIWHINHPAMRPLLQSVWFLATYYAFIIVHGVMKANGMAVFAVTGGPEMAVESAPAAGAAAQDLRLGETDAPPRGEGPDPLGRTDR